MKIMERYNKTLLKVNDSYEGVTIEQKIEKIMNAKEPIDETGRIKDLTTYIDPTKYNYIFADTNLDAMNFWVQTKFDIKVRRLISAKQIPNL